MRALVYCRVSTLKQDNERQVIQIEKYCKEWGIEIVKRYDEKASGLLEVRDELTHLLNDVKTANVDYVIVNELSRLGRNVEVINSIKSIHNSNTNFISIKENIKTDIKDPMGLQTANLLIGLLTSINTFELSTLKYRSKTGLMKSILNGGVMGSPYLPYGYQKINKKLVIDKEEAIVIKDIFNYYLQGNGTTKIANILNEHKILTRTEKILQLNPDKKKYSNKLKWVDGTIYSILKNTIYIGIRRFQGEEITQNNLKIIDKSIFDEVQSKLKSNYNKADKHTKHKYIISRSKIVCGVCNKNYFPYKKSSGKDSRYICISRRYKSSCGNYGISIEKIESLIHEVIFYLFTDKLQLSLEDKDINTNIKNIENDLIQYNINLDKYYKMESNILDWSITNKFSEKVIQAKLNELNINKIILKNDISKKEKELQELKNTINNIKNIDRIKLNYRAGEKLPKNIIDKIISKIIITKTNDFPSIFNNKQDKIVEVKIIAGIQEYNFLISQRTNYIYYLNGEYSFLLNKFLSGDLPRKAFDFVTKNI